MTTVETIKFKDAKVGDILMIPNLTTGAELSVIELKAKYEDNFQASGITGLIPNPKAELVVRVVTQRHPIRIEMFKK